jgi:hypothetical protein
LTGPLLESGRSNFEHNRVRTFTGARNLLRAPKRNLVAIAIQYFTLAQSVEHNAETGLIH